MSNQPTSVEQSEETATDSIAADNPDGEDHDCKDHLEYVDYEWVGSSYDDILVCEICDSEYRVVFARAFLLDGDDYSLVEEYTDSIEQDLRQLRDDQDDGTDEDEENAESVDS
ncbi:hypothetical protein MUK72_15550 (plasmid) [Halococcus dombrowskii]|uniref:Small CPxCG-related zinc finger protein n=1 Tax=Halococcus dombrowskii TaxID=179637 RepID=A0AAV3SDF8_HALDO|nr:hypothetical protein [Halococcus dombrowskii]UOO96610.1 hypothetical protein MUK72_15550 [Halococcus dombrowskii]